MKILVLDNYDSFTYNLVHMIRELGYGTEMKIIRNDKLTVADANQFDKILLSPGPGIPSHAGIMPELITKLSPTKSILGICLGHQAIAEAFGARIYNMKEVIHGQGIATKVTDDKDPVFANIPAEFNTGRYHSWSVVKDSLGENLIKTAEDSQGEIMAIRHREFDVSGLQFHPESILTENGLQIMNNWLQN